MRRKEKDQNQKPSTEKWKMLSSKASRNLQIYNGVVVEIAPVASIAPCRSWSPIFIKPKWAIKSQTKERSSPPRLSVRAWISPLQFLAPYISISNQTMDRTLHLSSTGNSIRSLARVQARGSIFPLCSPCSESRWRDSGPELRILLHASSLQQIGVVLKGPGTSSLCLLGRQVHIS